MKMETERVLGDHISEIVVTTPSILPHSHKEDIKLALNKASLSRSSCGEIEDSIIASTIATRFFHRHLKIGGGNISRAECLLGPFGFEEVTALTYMQKILVLSIFKIYTGLQTWTTEEMWHFVAIGDLGDLEINRDSTFWDNVTTGMRKTAIRRTTIFNQVLRVVLDGPSSLRPTIVSVI
jgi:hypothetical protein